MKFAAFILLIGIMAACGDADPEAENLPSLSADQFTAMMIDVQLAEGMKTQKIVVTKDDPGIINLMYDDIYKKHGVSAEDFKETFMYYRSRPEKMEIIYEQVLDSLSKLDVEVKQAYSASVKQEADSIQETTRRIRKSKQDSLQQ